MEGGKQESECKRRILFGVILGWGRKITFVISHSRFIFTIISFGSQYIPSD
jgi:hypothetical protein